MIDSFANAKLRIRLQKLFVVLRPIKHTFLQNLPLFWTYRVLIGSDRPLGASLINKFNNMLYKKMLK